MIARLGFLAVILIASLTAASSFAITHTVSQDNLTFQPAVITIQVGDTVEWVWTSGVHTVTNGVDLSDPDLGSIFDAALDASNPTFSYTFNTVGEVPYLCRPHFGLGMLGVVRVTSGITYTVNQVNLTFQPSDITIQVGDTVEWIWSSLAHTVTNGTDLGDPALGALFDEALDTFNPSVFFTFFTPGDVPYLCRPHFLLGMTGIVRVSTATPVEENPGPSVLTLYQNTPNPFNPATQVVFEIPGTRGSNVPTSLRIYDLQGRLIRTLVSEPLAATRHMITWDGRNDQGQMVASGVYAYRLVAGNLTASRQMTLLK